MRKFFVKDFEELKPVKNDTPYKRILAIGDIHGHFDRFMLLWEKVQVTEKDLVIFLGDYLDRGEKVVEILQWILQKSQEKNIIFLRGNHEQMKINEVNLTLQENSDAQTLTKFDGFESKTADKIFKFISEMRTSYKIKIGGRNYFFSHAGINPKIPLDEQNESDLLSIRGEFFNNYEGDAVIICGHTRVQYFFEEGCGRFFRQPWRFPGKNILLVDTGVVSSDGAVSCVDILTGEFWQSADENESDILQDGILFVCSGNTCRSPMAKYIMRDLLLNKGLNKKFYVDSAGCNTHGGSRMAKQAEIELIKNNILFDWHESKSFTQEDYKNFKYIIALDANILEQVKNICGGDPENKIRLLRNFQGNEINVDDPFGTDNYPQAYEKIYRGCLALMKELSQ